MGLLFPLQVAIIFVIVLPVDSWAKPRANTDPTTQSDLYVWKAPFVKPELAPYVDVKGYRVVHTQADQAISRRVNMAIKGELKGQCSESRDARWPIYQYDLGPDGILLMASCRTTSSEAWSVYYQLTAKNELKLLSFRWPILNEYTKKDDGVPPRITDYRRRSILKNSEILQRRVLSQSGISKNDSRHFQAEWVWKFGHGFVLLNYGHVVYSGDSKPVQTNLHSLGADF